MGRSAARKRQIKRVQQRILVPLSRVYRARLIRSHRLACALAITALWLAAASPPAWATFPGMNGRLAFSSDGKGNFDIHTMNPDGSGQVDIADVSTFDVEPAWSPDGAKLAFRSGRLNAGEIYTMNADGTGLTQLTFDSFRDRFPTWSPDGSMLAFPSNRNDPNFATCGETDTCSEDIFVISAAGGPLQQLTFLGGHTGHPRFSPDGRFLAYESDVNGSAVYKLDLQTFLATKLTPDDLQAGQPDWSPDGTKIAFVNDYACSSKSGQGKACKSDIFVMNEDGGSITQLTFKFGNNLDPHWSPEGDKIAFSHGNNLQFNQQQIYVMNSDGTGITKITSDNNNNMTPAWGSE